MATLRELLEGRELPVKVVCEVRGVYYEATHKNDAYFLLTVFNAETHQKIHDTAFSLDSHNWELYEEPKKTIELEEHLIMCFSGGYMPIFFKSDDEFKKEYPNEPLIKTGRKVTVEVPNE